ncbi:MAG: YkgJ family cysteine cluster protein [Candidatus Eremiobacterota bacterium]
MNIDKIKKIRFENRKMTIYESPGEEGMHVNYGDIPVLREKVIKFITSFVNLYGFYFCNYCSQCGNCCMRENILVTGNDLFSISTSLGMSEKEFYNTYLTHAGTWSDYDGFIKLKDGRCPFLEKTPSGRYKCKVYNDRPQSCRLYLSTSPVCIKDSSDLIEEIKYLDIINEQISFMSKSGQFYRDLPIFEELREDYSGLLSTLASIKDEEANKVKTALGKLKEIILDMEEGRVSNEYFIKNVHTVKEMLSLIWNQRIAYSSELDHLWAKISKIELEHLNKSKTLPDTPEESEDLLQRNDLFSVDNFTLKSIMFCPLTMNLTYTVDETEYNYSINYSSDRPLAEYITDFTRRLYLVIRENFPRVMDNFIPRCYMCGSCCTMFIIEIEPSDIRRMADELNMTETEFRETCTGPPRFSWNPGSVTMKKILDEEVNKHRCIFLKKGDLDLYYCSVHAFKPDLCREYKSGKPQCYRHINDDLYYRLLSNIQNINLNSETINVDTPYSFFKIERPVQISWHEHRELEDTVEILLKYLRQLLITKYFPRKETLENV